MPPDRVTSSRSVRTVSAGGTVISQGDERMAGEKRGGGVWGTGMHWCRCNKRGWDLALMDFEGEAAIEGDGEVTVRLEP